MQLWLRELRRLLVLLPLKNEQPLLMFADDGKVAQDRVALPAIHCRDCGAMGFLSQKAEDQQCISTDLDLIYRAFFERSAKSCVLFPMDQVDTPWNFPDSLDKQLCACCGYLNRRAQTSCQNCGSEDLLWVHQADNSKLEKNKHSGESNNKSHNDCDRYTLIRTLFFEVFYREKGVSDDKQNQKNLYRRVQGRRS